MVQILDRVPSFGERLIPALVESTGQIAEGYSKGKAQTALQKMLGQLNPQSNMNQNADINQQSNQQGQQQPTALDPMKLDVLYNTAVKARGQKGADALIQNVIESHKSQQKEQIQSRKEDVEAHKLTSDYREKVLEGYEAYQKTNNQLNRLKTLNEEGKLTTPLMAKLSDTLGIPLSVLANPESEEFQKLSQDLLGNITKVFGSRILQVEVENFLKTIPTLMNSKEGRVKIIDNMQLLMEPQKLQYDAYKDIRKKGGRIPLDLHEQVLETLEPKLDKLAEKFKQSSDTLNALPSPNAYKGQRIENTDTGEIFISDGNEWKPIGAK